MRPSRLEKGEPRLTTRAALSKPRSPLAPPGTAPAPQSSQRGTGRIAARNQTAISVQSARRLLGPHHGGAAAKLPPPRFKIGVR